MLLNALVMTRVRCRKESMPSLLFCLHLPLPSSDTGRFSIIASLLTKIVLTDSLRLGYGFVVVVIPRWHYADAACRCNLR